MTRESIGSLDFSAATPIPSPDKASEEVFVRNLHKGAKEIGRDFNAVKTAYYPLAQSDIATVMVACPNVEKVIMTGAQGAGATSLKGYDGFDGYGVSKKPLDAAANLCTTATSFADSIFNFNSAMAFRHAMDQFPKAGQDATYPTLLLMAASIHNRFGVNTFGVNKTEFGHSLTFELNGKKREVEYVDFFLDTDVSKEDAAKRQYLANIKADLLVNKAIPFEDLSEFPSAIAILTGSVGARALVLSDESFASRGVNNRYNKRPIVPTAVFGKVSESSRSVVICPENRHSTMSFAMSFGYGNEAFLTSGEALIPLDDKSRRPEHIDTQRMSHRLSLWKKLHLDPDARNNAAALKIQSNFRKSEGYIQKFGDGVGSTTRRAHG